MSRLNWDADRNRTASRGSRIGLDSDEPVHSKHGESQRKPSKRRPAQRKPAPSADPLRERVSSETRLGEARVAIEKLRREPSPELAEAAGEALREELAESRRKLDSSGLGRTKTKSMRRELDELAFDLEEEIEQLRPE